MNRSHMPQNRKPVELGVEKLLEGGARTLRGARVGLICNQASVDHNLRHVADLFHASSDIRLTALFGPQHGIRGDVQDNMIETGHGTDASTGLPVYSLYSETREPTETMLDDVDVLVFDMQDVGCRIYTFVYTLANCMRAAGKLGKKVVVCDRPNPINGIAVEGNLLESQFVSFVGQFPLPTRHGMTVGELGRMLIDYFAINCEFEAITMDGWQREYWHDDIDAPWVMPSPNMPTLDSATVFPGSVHFEGTQLSEGRGTTRPFELIGAPYIDPNAYAEVLNELQLQGVYFRSCVFQPTFQKHVGVSCGGVQIHVLDRQVFEPVTTGVAMVKVAHDLYPQEFKWKDPPYEYVYDQNPFDVICGTDKIRKALEEGSSLEEIVGSWDTPVSEFTQHRKEFLLY
ncbi:MAG: exo-beta-N-acetylmuramidase NamZ domain-containing protein [Pyrinomonadaceae bacterium]